MSESGDTNPDAISAFEDNLISQLTKNGYPEKAVGFPLETLFEAASRKGFSFNRVRERLEARGIEVELGDTRIVFRSRAEPAQHQEAQTPASTRHQDGFQDIAKDLLSKISPEQMKQFREIIGKLSPQERLSLQQDFESMDEGQKRELMLKMKGLFGS